MKNTNINNVFRGEIWWADLPHAVGSEQGGKRPILIIQNNTGNKFSPTVIAAIITSKKTKAKLPTHVHIPASDEGLSKDSIIEMEQIKTLDKSCLIERIGSVSMDILEKVNDAILISLGLIKRGVKPPALAVGSVKQKPNINKKENTYKSRPTIACASCSPVM